jgi:hypothetical protein
MQKEREWNSVDHETGSVLIIPDACRIKGAFFV